jgi:hypothetical protein
VRGIPALHHHLCKISPRGQAAARATLSIVELPISISFFLPFPTSKIPLIHKSSNLHSLNQFQSKPKSQTTSITMESIKNAAKYVYTSNFIHRSIALF